MNDRLTVTDWSRKDAVTQVQAMVDESNESFHSRSAQHVSGIVQSISHATQPLQTPTG